MITLTLSNSDAKTLIDLLNYLKETTRNSKHPKDKNKGRVNGKLSKKLKIKMEYVLRTEDKSR